MSKQWYDNDWFICFMVGLTALAAIVGNYYYHGGHIVW